MHVLLALPPYRLQSGMKKYRNIESAERAQSVIAKETSETLVLNDARRCCTSERVSRRKPGAEVAWMLHVNGDVPGKDDDGEVALATTSARW